MSVLNGYQGQQAARPQSRPQDPAHSATSPNWGQQGGHPTHSGAPQQPQWPPQASSPSYAPQGYAPASNFGQGQDYHFPQPPAPQQSAPQGYGGGTPDPYAPQFEPYVPAAPARAPQQSAQPAYAPQSYPQAPAYPPVAAAQPQYQGFGQEAPRQQTHGHQAGHQAVHQTGHQPAHQTAHQPSWGQQPQQPDPRGFDIGGFGHQPAHAQQHASYGHQPEPHYQEEPTLGDWQQPQHQHGGYQGGYQAEGHDDMGFAQPAGGELDAGYGEEELEEEYEEEAPSRFRRPMMIAVALVGAIVVGGGLAQGYKYFLGSGAGGDPPVIKSASGPAKVKPADAGGKQFPHADSKIMGRLGDGASATGSASAAADSDPNGSRKVATLVVGRDGSIQAPAATAAPVEPAQPAAPVAVATVSVPGMTVVDAFGNQPKPSAAEVAAVAPPAAPANQKIFVSPPAAPPQKPVTIAKATPAETPETGSIASDADAVKEPAPPPAKKVKKTAAAAPAAAAPAASTSVATTGSGYVAVLASVPRSEQSRMTALKQFADMQQKYGSVLAGKTPDVAEANLGTKGNYHRLVVGPPGSRNQAATLCSQLKSQGFNDCWVTSY